MKQLIIILLLIISVHGYSQLSRTIRIGVGHETHNMNQLQEFQKKMIYKVRLNDIKAVERFPDNIFYSVSYSEPIGESNYLGIDISYLTTGGRNHVSDYSGEYKADLILNGYKGGLSFGHLAPKSIGKINFSIQLSSGVVYSEFDVRESLKVYESSHYDETEFSALTVFAEPAFIFSRSLMENIFVDLSIGYQIDVYIDKLSKSHNRDYKIDAKPEWNGIKSSIGINYKL